MITKRSSEFNELTGLPAGSPLSGAVFEIYNITGNLVDKISSDRNGIAASKGLPVGVYTIKEVSAPRYYALNDRTLLAEIRHNGDIVRFEVLNSSISLNLTIRKAQVEQHPDKRCSMIFMKCKMVLPADWKTSTSMTEFQPMPQEH